MQRCWIATERRSVSNTIPVLPDLELLDKVGEGGMATVWRARDLKRNEIVAVKILHPELTVNPEDVELFIAEERIMEQIDHPGFVKSYGIFQYGNTWYYVMEFVDGYTFGSLLARKQHLGESDCLLICESIAVALDHAWNDHGVVHCDIKPENIMINSSGVVKLTDLGLCHTFAYLKDGRQNVPEHVMGTPAYISPEQVYGDVEPDCRSDIYSLAATIYHLATGRLLFPGMTSEEMMRAHCDNSTKAKDPRLYRPTLSEGFCQMLEAMLVKNRDYRIQSWRDIFSMCVEIEQGHIFKPRESNSPSSTDILSLEHDASVLQLLVDMPANRPAQKITRRSAFAELKAFHAKRRAAEAKIGVIIPKRKAKKKVYRINMPIDW